MKNYVGKICPFCRTSINENDEVIVCHACAAPHHKACWDENKGCTTFGCSEQHYVAQGTNPIHVCKKCGATLGDGQDFCPKCGTPKNANKSNVCGKCGATLQDGQDFCPKCGQKVGLSVDTNVSSAISQFNNAVSANNAKKKKKPFIIGATVIGVLLAGFAVMSIAPKIFIDMEGYLEQGNYEKAYEKAKTDSDKQAVRLENLAAVESSYSADSLKDPSSFVLRDAYYNEHVFEGKTTPHLVLYISGANSYGATVSSYWLYKYDEDNDEWEYYTSVSDLSDEKYSEYDDTDDFLEKMLNNGARDYIKEAMHSGDKLSKDGVKRINKMFEDDVLDDVGMLYVD